jgi:hypothetical protein
VPSPLRVIVTGLIAQHPLLGGMTWHYLQYVLGFQRLGHDVLYLEDSGEWPYNLDGGASGENFLETDCTANVTHLARVMQAFGLGDRWAYRCPIEAAWHGVEDRRRDQALLGADLLVNVSGTLARPMNYRGAGCLAYVDTDPVFTQVKLAEGDAGVAAAVGAHDVRFTFGEALAGEGWHATRQPVVLSEWRSAAPHGNAFTTVMNWWSYAEVDRNGRTLGQKDVEFARFLELPRLVDVPLEIAVRGTRKGILPGIEGEREPEQLHAGLTRHGWRVVDAVAACGDAEAYRAYIHRSAGEWTVAKNAYVEGRSGWLGDRSPCYLAAGRPVIVQDTGLDAVLPVGEGLVTFRTLAEAADALGEVRAHYERHALRARELAEALFDAGKVLPQLAETALASRSTVSSPSS